VDGAPNVQFLEVCQGQQLALNGISIAPEDRLFHWDRSAPRPGDHPGLGARSLGELR